MIPADRAQAHVQLSQCLDVLELAFVGLNIDEFLQKYSDYILSELGVTSYESYLQGIRPVAEGEAFSGSDDADEDDDAVVFSDMITFVLHKLHTIRPELDAIKGDLRSRGVSGEGWESKLTYVSMAVALLPVSEGRILKEVPLVLWPSFWLTKRLSVADDDSRALLKHFVDFLKAITDTVEHTRSK